MKRTSRVLVFLCLGLAIQGPLTAQEQRAAAAKPPVAPLHTTGEENSAASAKLPVRRVVLYKNGIGYFEHLGRVRGSQEVHIDFTSAQLNDVLKSLTVLDLSGGRITGVDYNTEAPLARRLASLRLALGEKPTEAEFLGALRGAKLEVHSGTGAVVAGRLLSVERKTRAGPSGNWTVETDEISLVTDSGEVRAVDLSAATAVRVIDRDLNLEIGKYLNLIASAREQDVRRMSVRTAGSGDRSLYVSYISEVPIWKTTYRIVLPSKEGKKPLLQGWAIIDNTVGEDWTDVELSLVAGAPHSFIQRLSEPYYGRRPVVALPEATQLSPQTHTATLVGGNGRLSGAISDLTGAAVPGARVQLMNETNGVLAQTTSDSNGQYVFSSLAPGNYRVRVEGNGFKSNVITNLNIAAGENQVNSRLQVGTSSESIEVRAETVALETDSAALAVKMPTGVANRAHVAMGSGSGGGASGGVMGMAMLAPGTVENSLGQASTAASGQDLGDLFEYKLKDRVTLKKNQSALVPVAQTEIDAEKVSLWSGTNGSGRPLRGLWLKNTSALTLDGGSFSVLEKEVFAGEGLTDPIKPGERRLISYATDLGLLVEAEQNLQPQHVTLVKIVKGVMTQASQLQQRTLYTVRNQGDAPGAVVVEHPARTGWLLAKGAKEPEERAPGTYRFRLEVPAKATASLPVEEIQTLNTTYEIADLEPAQIAMFLKQRTITKEMAEALARITAQKGVVAELEQEMANRQKDIDRIVEDQGRLRENMKALRGSAEEKALLQRYTKQLDEQETQLEQLRKKIQETEKQRDTANEKLQTMVEELQLEATFL
jgi:hypothetical protein